MKHEAEPWYQRAEAVAAKWHDGQVDKIGLPYIGHLRRVAAILVDRFPDARQAEIEAALLHDVFEDTDATAADLVEAGISPDAIAIALEVSKPRGAQVPYMPWIGSLLMHASTPALRVKLADNLDNRDPDRVRAANTMVAVLTKYEPAGRAIEGELKRRASYERRGIALNAAAS